MCIEVSVVEVRRVFLWIWSKKNLVVLALSLLWGRQWKTICQLDYSRKNMLFLFSDNHFTEFSITEVQRRQDGILAVPFCQPKVGPSLQIDHGVVISLAPDWWNMLRFVQQLRIYDIYIYNYIYIPILWQPHHAASPNICIYILIYQYIYIYIYIHIYIYQYINISIYQYIYIYIYQYIYIYGYVYIYIYINININILYIIYIYIIYMYSYKIGSCTVLCGSIPGANGPWSLLAEECLPDDCGCLDEAVSKPHLASDSLFHNVSQVPKTTRLREHNSSIIIYTGINFCIMLNCIEKPRTSLYDANSPYFGIQSVDSMCQ